MPPPSQPAAFGRYRILDEIGRGATGRVYRAHDPNTDRTVALKVLAIDESLAVDDVAQVHARFLREARAAGRLQHPGIVAIYDADIDAASGSPYLAMELVEGRSVAERLSSQGPLAWPVALSIATTVAEALDHAHERGVVHRDLKPANVLLAKDGTVKVSDFGVAMLLDESSTLTGTIRGTPAYMAPEQIRGHAVDGRTDLYALGAVLYEMLTGEAPFHGDSVVAVAHQAVHDQPRPPSMVAPNLPLALEQLVVRALSKSPAERPASGREMAAALRAAADPDDEPSAAVEATVAIAQSPDDTQPTPASPRRRRSGAAIGVVAVVVAVIAAGIWLARGSSQRDASRAFPAESDTESAADAMLTIDWRPNAEATDGATSGETPEDPATETADLEATPIEPPAGEPPPTPSESGEPAGPAVASAPRSAPPQDPPTPQRPAPPKPSASAAGSPADPPVTAIDPSSRVALPSAKADPDSSPTEAPTPAAIIELHFVNRIKAGTLTISIDGEPVWSTPLESPANIFKRLGGEELIGSIPVPAGEHDVEAHVVNESERIDVRGAVSGELAPGETRLLRVVLVPFGSKLRVKWED